MIIPLHFISFGKETYMGNNSIKLSIIVPVYKTEQYLKRCLSSILEQEVDRSLYEVIIINDGSPDNSQPIIEDFCDKYNNASYLIQSNQGLSMARNNGMDRAQGEYIWFIDSDDWVKDNSISCILKECGTTPDAISISYIKEGADSASPAEPYTTTGMDVLQTKHFARGMVFYILRREFIKMHNLSIYPGIYHEDAEFTPRMLYFAQSVRVIPDPLYFMYSNPASITRSVNPKRSFDLLTVSDNLYKFKEIIVDQSIQKVFDYLISVNINTALANISTGERSEQIMFNKALHDRVYLLPALWNSHLKYRIEYVLFKLFPNKYVETYKFIKRK